MFDQLTWSLGMFTQSACFLFAAGYCLRNTALAQTWHHVYDQSNPESALYKVVWSSIGLALIYSLLLGFLQLTDSSHDSLVLDSAIVVLLLGGLVVHPLAAIIATVPSLLLRASLMFSYSADSATKANYESHGRWVLDSDFWIEEIWIWRDPSVVLLLTCAVLGICFNFTYRFAKKRDYPIWMGIPIALISQFVFVVTAIFQWDWDSAIVYLQNDAVPAAISIAIVTTAVVVLLRALTSVEDRHLRQDAELASTRDQLKFLNAQINPHFLNNSLNAVAAISITQPERTSELISNLARHYRAQCDVTSSLARFEDELRLVRCYIDIEQVRMGNRVTVQENIDPACFDVPIPRLVIQPLVENAIQHGIQVRSESGLLKLKAFLRGNSLIVTVEDNGPGQMKKLTQSDFGTGLNNVCSRLAHFYGGAASLKTESEWGMGTRAILNIPAMIEEPA